MGDEHFADSVCKIVGRRTRECGVQLCKRGLHKLAGAN
jgi:hypothetical protein